MQPRAKSTLVKPSMTIKEVMTIIQREPHADPPGPGHIALVVDEKNKLLGTITDGDIRRAILKGVSLQKKATAIMKTPIVFSAELSPDEILAQTIETIKTKKLPGGRLEFIITVDKQNRVEDVFSFFDLWKTAEIKTRTFAVVGLGYVGLTLSLVLAENGYKVVGIDTDKSIVADLKVGKSHVFEPGINALLKRHLGKNLIVQNRFEKAESDVYIISVGTPVDKNKKVDNRPLTKALRSITKYLKPGDLVLLRSTVAVGTCRNLVVPLLEKATRLKAGKDFFVAFAPERTVEGNAISELKNLPQIIGGLDKKSTELAVKVFDNITDNIVLVDNLESAELIKLLNNTYRDLTFAFANEVAKLCNKLRLDSHKIIKAANQGYSRSQIPLPSPGVGGPCLTKDPYILSQSAKPAGVELKLPLISRKINDSMVNLVVNKVSDFLKKLDKPNAKIRIFALGMAFKGRPETGDLRSSTGVLIVKELMKEYSRVTVFDPVAENKDMKKAGLRPQPIKQGFRKADCILVLNNHKLFSELDIVKLIRTANKPVLLFDAWHVFESSVSHFPKGIEYRTL